MPAACIEDGYAILEGDWEIQSRSHIEAIEVGLYDELETKARQELGISGDRNKPLIARFIAEALVSQGRVPRFVTDILKKVQRKLPD